MRADVFYCAIDYTRKNRLSKGKRTKQKPFFLCRHVFCRGFANAANLLFALSHESTHDSPFATHQHRIKESLS